MSPAAPSPRPDQIAELTRGLALPLGAIDDVFLEILAEGISDAFDAIRRASPAAVATGSEAEVTALLVTRLNSMIDEEDGLWRRLVTSVTRGAESLNYDGSLLEKRPDLSIHLSDRTARFPLIAEAKLIDRTAGERLYCANGIRRFVEGEYAWGCREAFMIGYVRDGTKIATKLTPYLARAANAGTYLVKTAPTALMPALADVAASAHDRAFNYRHITAPHNAPGAIMLWHLWLS